MTTRTRQVIYRFSLRACTGWTVERNLDRCQRIFGPRLPGQVILLNFIACEVDNAYPSQRRRGIADAVSSAGTRIGPCETERETHTSVS